jgi:hypothetical protein
MCDPVSIAVGVVGAGASAYSASKQASAAKKATAAATEASNQEIALQREARDEARKIFTPYSQEGAAARRMYNAAMGIAPTGTMPGGTGADTLEAARAAYDQGFEASPYWRDAQYGADQAMNALRSTNGAMGRGSSINSGKALRAAQDIQTGYRGQATMNYLNGLGSIIDTGLTADSGIASGGQTYANNAGNAIRNAASVQGNAAMAGAQAWGNAASDIAGFIGYGLGQWKPGGNKYFRPSTPSTPGFSNGWPSGGGG